MKPLSTTLLPVNLVLQLLLLPVYLLVLAIAVVALPEEPLVAFALVIGPLIELPVLALISQVLLGIKRWGLFSEGTRAS